MRITIFGAGAFGQALGHILSENNHQVTYYDPQKFPGISLDSALTNPEALVLATPSAVTGSLLSSLPDFTHNLPLICASKGFVSLAPFRLFSDFSAIGGPTFAHDLEEHHPTILTASSDLPVKLFSTKWLRVEQTPDKLGIMLCSTLKNIYAIESGYRHLSPTKESFLQFINSAHSEIKHILQANNCNPSTANLACGLADLTMTCSSSASRNYTFGSELATNPHTRPTYTAEGVSAVFSLINTPSFIIPDQATILTEIIKKIRAI